MDIRKNKTPGVSIDELTTKAKLEMVKVGKSGKVFGNKN